MLCEILSELHEQRNIVHGDIRKSNILFSNDCQSAYFIDFDLADHEDVPYLSNFNHIEERHKNALPYRPRRKEHDRYSLWKSLVDVGFNNEQFLDLIKGSDSLSTIVQTMKNS